MATCKSCSSFHMQKGNLLYIYVKVYSRRVQNGLVKLNYVFVTVNFIDIIYSAPYMIPLHNSYFRHRHYPLFILINLFMSFLIYFIFIMFFFFLPFCFCTVGRETREKTFHNITSHAKIKNLELYIYATPLQM